jgi:hypothetical protein
MGIAVHIELAIVLKRALEAQSLIETHGGIDSENVQANCLIDPGGLANHTLYCLCADTPPLKRTVHEELSNKKGIIFREALEPAGIGTVERYDAL